MSLTGQQIYPDQLITQYLLGLVTEDEAEQLDELSITDHEFAARLQDAENDLVDSYVGGELSAQELEQFQAWYLRTPKRRERVRLARALRAVEIPAAVPSPRESSPPIPRAAKRFNFFPQTFWQWAPIAAAFVLMFTGAWLLYDNLRLRRTTNLAQAERAASEQREQELRTHLAQQQGSATPAHENELAGLREELARLQQQPRTGEQPTPAHRTQIATFVLLPQLRGGVEREKTIAIPANTDYVNMRLELEPVDFPRYQAVLKSLPDQRVIWQSGKLPARTESNKRSVIVSFRADLLKSFRYILEVNGVDQNGASEVVGGYPFAVTRK